MRHLHLETGALGTPQQNTGALNPYVKNVTYHIPSEVPMNMSETQGFTRVLLLFLLKSHLLLILQTNVYLLHKENWSAAFLKFLKAVLSAW